MAEIEARKDATQSLEQKVLQKAKEDATVGPTDGHRSCSVLVVIFQR